MQYIRFRFKTKSVDDPRPLKDLKLIGMPYWISGYTCDNFDTTAAIIICYLPKGVDIKEYWDDAFEIEEQERSEITYTDRFPKPDWIAKAENT